MDGDDWRLVSAESANLVRGAGNIMIASANGAANGNASGSGGDSPVSSKRRKAQNRTTWKGHQTRSDRESTTGSGNREPDARHGHHFHGCPSRHLEDDLARPRSGPKIRYRSRYRSQEGARHPHRIRWCPSHHGIEGNEIADEWAEQAADEPDAHGVEWLDYKDPHGIARKRLFPLPRSLAQLQARLLGAKVDGGLGLGPPIPATANTDRVRNRSRMPSWQVPTNASPPGYQTGHCLTGHYLQWTPGHEMLMVPAQHSDP